MQGHRLGEFSECGWRIVVCSNFQMNKLDTTREFGSFKSHEKLDSAKFQVEHDATTGKVSNYDKFKLTNSPNN